MNDILTSDSPQHLTPTEVNDTDYTITGINGHMVAFTAISAPRNVYLPPSGTMAQTVMVMDESGTCGTTNTITIYPDGTDTIEGSSYRILSYPFCSLTLESTGSGEWVVVANPNPSLSAGIQLKPSYTDNGDGSITFGSGVYSVYTNTDGIGKIKRYNISGHTIILADNTNTFIVADYNSGTPIIYDTTDVSIINETTIIPIYTIYRRGTVLHIIEWDELGNALGNKLHQSIVKTDRFRVEPGGLTLGEAATRYVTVTAGNVWHGAVKTPLAVSNSSIDTMWLAYHVAGVWTFAATTTYNNTQYDDGTDLQTLPGGKYAVNFVYRVVGTNDNDLVIFLGQDAYSLGDAQASQPPANLPAEVISHAVLVGRIIVNQGGSTAIQIDSAFSTQFSPAGVTDHNALTNLQGGTTDEYYHLTSAEYTGVGTGNFVRVDAPTVTGTWTFSGQILGTAPASSSGTIRSLSPNSTETSGTIISLRSDVVAAPSASSSAIYASYFTIATTLTGNAQNLTSSTGLNGVYSQARHLGTGTATGVSGLAATSDNGSTGTVTDLMGVRVQVRNLSTGVVTSACGVRVISASNTSGTVTTLYGLCIDSQTKGTTNYAIYTNLGAVRFGDSLYVDSSIASKVYTVATLPTGSQGMRAFVSDANATTFASIVAGGGANALPVYYDGANWRIG